MPLSRPDTLPRVINLIWETNPQSILDVGVGWGAMGVLFRQTCDIRWGRLEHWQTVIHGIEIHAEYTNPLWSYVYNKVFFGNALEEIPKLIQSYDVVFLGDIIEHLEKDQALKLLKLAIEKANRYVIITTPASFSQNADEAVRFGNPYEEHKCFLENSDFPKDTIIETYGNQRVIIIKKP